MVYMNLSELQPSRPIDTLNELKLKALETSKSDIRKIEVLIDSEKLPIPLVDCYLYLKALYIVESFYMDTLSFDYIERFNNLDLKNPTDIVLLTEFANFKAKKHDKSCYSLKVSLAYHAYKNGATVSYSSKDKTYCLYTKNSGVVSIHDPYRHVSNLFNSRGIEIDCREIGWSGIFRQKYALAILIDEELRQFVAQVTDLGVKNTHDEKKEFNDVIAEKADKWLS